LRGVSGMLDGIRRVLESVAEALKTRRLSEEEIGACRGVQAHVDIE